jgi:SnoaL-like domain
MMTNGRSALAVWVAAVVVAASALGTSLALADAGERGDKEANAEQRADKEAIANLIYCYARGTDAIGDATTNADPLAKGTSIYRQCFTDSAEIRAWFPQQPFDAQAFPDPNAFPSTAPQAYIGPVAWAQFVNSVFRGNGYTFTQHMMANVNVTVHGKHGRLTAYLNATHVISGTEIGGPSQCVAVANGTYSGDVEKFGDDWRFTRVSLTLITFNPVFQTGKGC